MELRTRLQYNITSTSLREQAIQTTCTHHGWSDNGEFGRLNVGETMVMADYVVPDFHKRRAAGEVFFNNMSKEKVTVSAKGTGFQLNSVNLSCAAPQYKATFRCLDKDAVAAFVPLQVPNGHGHQLPVIETCLSDAEILRVRKLVSTEVWSKRGRGPHDLWEATAEFGKTLAMLDKPLARLKDTSMRILKSAQSGSGSRQLLKEMSDGYLMYRYGVLPAMRDIGNIVASLSKTRGIKRISTRASEQLYGSKVVTTSTTKGIILTTWQNHIAETCTLRALSLDETDVWFMTNTGFSLKNLITLPWELMSYSFVADWFANIGDYIGASAPSFGYTQLGSCLVEKRVTANGYTITGSSLTSSSYVLTTKPEGSVGIIRETTTRSPLEKPSVEWRSDFKLDSVTRCMDALGLIAARFGKVASLTRGVRPNHSAFRDRNAYHLWAEQTGNPPPARYQPTLRVPK